MNAEEILAKVRAEEQTPEGWVVFPLQRNKLLQGLLWWIFGIVMGLGLLAFIVPIVLPGNYQHGLFGSILTTLLLGMLLFVTIGSAWLLVADIRRLQHLEKHVIVLTDEAFVKQEGDTVIYVPLESIRYVTPRGRPPAERAPESLANTREVSQPGVGLLGFFVGRSTASTMTGTAARSRRKRTRTPTSLAFIDTRSDTEVTVVTDAAYGDPFYIAAVLKEYTVVMQ